MTKFKGSQETEDAINKREMIRYLVERRYGALPTNRSENYRKSLESQSFEMIRAFHRDARAFELAQLRKKAGA